MPCINKYEKNIIILFFFLEWLKGSTERKERVPKKKKKAGIENLGGEK